MTDETETQQQEQQEEQQESQQETQQEQQGPTPEEQLVQLREENARLQGELAGRVAAPPARPAEPPKGPRTLDDMTVDELERTRAEIETKIDAGEITAARGASILGDIAAIKRDRVREQREAVQAPIRAAEEKLGGYIAKHPDLKRQGSELLGKVSAEMPEVVRTFGFQPDDPRAQVIAVERVVGGHRLGGGGMDFRRRIPTGGTGSGAADSPDRTTKADVVAEAEKAYPDLKAYWDRLGVTGEARKQEAALALQRRPRRARSA